MSFYWLLLEEGVLGAILPIFGSSFGRVLEEPKRSQKLSQNCSGSEALRSSCEYLTPAPWVCSNHRGFDLTFVGLL